MKPIFACVLLLTATAAAETFTVATYNIENFRENFQAQTLATTRPALEPEFKRRLQKEDDEDNWEVSQVLLDPAFNPDIVLIQEGCTKEQLEKFNDRWLRGAYETLIVFRTNTDRNQHTGVMLKKGFKVLEKRDGYFEEKDTVDNPRGDRLFARGPGFVLVQTPGGYKFWIGTNHQKSKSGNDVDVTRWRMREAARTNQIIWDLSRSSGTSDVIFLGDMNDEIGFQEFELEAGGDVIATLAGAGSSELLLVTRELAMSGAISYGGYWDGRHRTFIDHVVATPSMKDKLGEPRVVATTWAKVASDHFPVMVKVSVP